MIPYRDENPLERPPLVTLSLIGANVAVFAYCVTSGRFEEIVERWGHVPAAGETVTLVTSTFLHGGIGHLLANMWYLWLFGDNVEDKIGHGLYLLFYLGCGIVASVLHGLMANPQVAQIPSIGASGAVSGVLGAYLVMFPWSNVNCVFLILFRPLVLKIPAFFFIGIWIVGQLVVGFYTREQQVAGVAYFAHVGGFGAGFVAGILFRMRRKYEQKRDLILDEEPHMVPQVNTVRQERVRRDGARVVHALRRSDASEVVKSYADFERHNPRLPLPEPAQWAAAEVLRNQGQGTLALEAYRKYVKHYPQGLRLRGAYFAVGELYRARHNFAAAVQAYEAVIRHFADSPEGQKAREALGELRAELDRTGLEAPSSEPEKTYLIIRQTGGKLDVSEVGRVIARTCSLTLLEGRMHAARTGGVLMAGLSYEQARAAAGDLQAAGIPVLAISQDDAIYYPDPVQVREVAWEEGGATIQNGESFSVRWANLWLVSLGRILIEKTVEDVVGIPDDLGVQLMRPYYPSTPRTKIVRRHEKREAVLLDLYFRDPMLHLRLSKDRFRAGPDLSAEAGMTRMGTFTHMVKRIIEQAPHAQVGEGVDRFFSEESLRPVTFRSKEQYEDYLFWQVQLHAHSFAGRSGD